jgi:SAM-dependent methyltransferase
MQLEGRLNTLFNFFIGRLFMFSKNNSKDNGNNNEQKNYIIMDNERKTFIMHPENAEETQNWPKNRSINDIECILREFLLQRVLNLPNGARILDVGCGNGNFIKELALTYPKKGFIFSTITTTKIEFININNFNDITYSYVPDLEWLDKNAQSCDFITDIYASLTYSDNPLNALCCLMLAAKKGGTILSISSMIPDDSENSMFGNSGTRNAITKIFKEKLGGVDINFSLVDIESQACKPGAIMRDLKIEIKIPELGIILPSAFKNAKKMLSPREEYEFLTKYLEKKIGTPKKKWVRDDDFIAGKYRITPRSFERKNGKEWPTESELAKNNFPNLEILDGGYTGDLVDYDYKDHLTPVTNIMKIHPEWHQSSEHVIALYRLFHRKNMTEDEAEKELLDLTSPQARYIARGLSRQEVLALTTPELHEYKHNIPLDALCELKSEGLTLQDLVWTTSWFNSTDQLDELKKLIKNNIPSIAIQKLYQQQAPLTRLSSALAANCNKAANKHDFVGLLLNHFNGPASSKGRPPYSFIEECAKRQGKTPEELIKEVEEEEVEKLSFDLL